MILGGVLFDRRQLERAADRFTFDPFHVLSQAQRRNALASRCQSRLEGHGIARDRGAGRQAPRRARSCSRARARSPASGAAAATATTPSSRAVDRLAAPGRVLVNEVRDQHRNVVDALAKRRHDDRNDVQAIEQIVLEPALVARADGGRGWSRRSRGRRRDSGAFGAERLDLALLQHAQQLGLQADAHRADLVEKDRPAVGQRELAFLRAGGVRERPADVAEELGFQQASREWPHS